MNQNVQLSPIAKAVIDEMAEHLGASSQDIDPFASLTEDLELSPVQIEDLLRFLAEKFDIEFEDLKGSYKTVNQIIEAIEDNQLE